MQNYAYACALLLVGACGGTSVVDGADLGASDGLVAIDGATSCTDEACAGSDGNGACEACGTGEAVVCTSAGLNAKNACRASACFAQTVAHAGLCADGPTCQSSGGHCAVRRAGWFCADGERFDPGDQQSDCAQGDFDDICCRSGWSAPCTYLGVVSATLSVNPFTCAAADVPVCVSSADATSCTRDALVGRSVGGAKLERLDAQTVLTVSANAKVDLAGHTADGRSFHCTGTWSADSEVPGALACETCLGTTCSACAIQQTHACRLP